MRESNLRQTIIKLLHSLDAQAVENSSNPGTPDVEYIGGWIELKYIKELPSRETTPIRVPHFTQQQRVWLMKRAMRGGRVSVLLRLVDDFYLFDGMLAARRLGDMTHAEIKNTCIAHWYRSINGEQLLTILTTGMLDNARSCT